MGVQVNRVTSECAKMMRMDYNKSCKVASGMKEGYNIAVKTIADENDKIQLIVWFSVAKELRNFERRFIRGSKYEHSQFEKVGHRVKLTWNTGHSIEESAMKNLCDMVKWLLEMLKKEEYVNCDERGYVGISDVYFYDDEVHFLNKTSKDIIQKGKEEDIEAYIRRTENMFSGVLGALLPAVIGAGLLFLLKGFGNLVFVSGLVMGLGGGLWYRKRAGKFTIISVTLCFVIFFVATCLIYPLMLKFDFGTTLLAGPVSSLVYLFVILFFSQPKVRIVKLSEGVQVSEYAARRKLN